MTEAEKETARKIAEWWLSCKFLSRYRKIGETYWKQIMEERK